MLYYLDTEFVDEPGSLEVVSLALVAEDGRELYMERLANEISRIRPNSWVCYNVLPRLWSRAQRPMGSDPHTHGFQKWLAEPGHHGGVFGTIQMAREIDRFTKDDDQPEFWGYYADYDWVLFCWLYGAMVDLPLKYPKFCRDLKQSLAEAGDPTVPIRNETSHHALSDARWIRDAHAWLRSYREESK